MAEEADAHRWAKGVKGVKFVAPPERSDDETGESDKDEGRAPVAPPSMKRESTVKMKRFGKKGPRNVPDVQFVDQAIKIRAQLYERKRRQRFIFRPGESQILNYWDYAGAIMLLYTATFTPFEVAFLPSASPTNVRFIFNRVLDVFFSLDLVAQFFISVRPSSAEEATGQQFSDQESWVDDHRIIARRYISGGWFFFDVFTLGPSVLDILPHIMGPDMAQDGFLGDASILRTLRVLRFVKIFRVARVGRLLQRWAARVTLKHSTLTVIKCLVYLLVAAHWYACIFALQASLHSTAQDTWLGKGSYEYCEQPDLKDQEAYAAAEATLPPYCGESGLDYGTWYVASFSWSTMVITGTGGTDFYPSSKSVAETILVTLLVLIGAILWTQILALFCDVATNSDPGAVRFRQTVDEMNSYLEMHRLPQGLRLRVREYLHAQRDCQSRLETSKAVSALSPSLQVEVIMEVQKHFFERVPFLRNAEAPCVVQVCLEMSSGVFAPGELALLQHMYVIERGVVLHRGRVLTFGKVWGHEDVILDDDLIRYARTERARAMSFMEYRGLARDALQRIVRQFPQTRKSLRRRAIYVALRRQMVEMLQHVRRERGELAPNGLLSQISRAASNEEKKLADRAAAIDSLQKKSEPISGVPIGNDNIEVRINELESVTRKRFTAVDQKLDHLADSVGRILSVLKIDGGGGGGGGSGKSRRSHRSTETRAASTMADQPPLASMGSAFAGVGLAGDALYSSSGTANTTARSHAESSARRRSSRSSERRSTTPTVKRSSSSGRSKFDF